jgi:hypothetical protein
MRAASSTSLVPQIGPSSSSEILMTSQPASSVARSGAASRGSSQRCGRQFGSDETSRPAALAASMARSVAAREGLARERRGAHVQHARLGDQRRVHVVLGDHHVGRGVPEEQEAAPAVLLHRDEGDAGLGGAVHAHAAHVDALLGEPPLHEGAEVVGPDERHEAGAHAGAGQPDRHVAGRAAEVPVEDVALGQRNAGAIGEEVDQSFAEGEDV